MTILLNNGYFSCLGYKARQLIEEGNVIKVIIDTVMELLREHLDSNNRFHFQGYNSDKFFRVQVIFIDLK